MSIYSVNILSVNLSVMPQKLCYFWMFSSLFSNFPVQMCFSLCLLSFHFPFLQFICLPFQILIICSRLYFFPFSSFFIYPVLIICFHFSPLFLFQIICFSLFSPLYLGMQFIFKLFSFSPSLSSSDFFLFSIFSLFPGYTIFPFLLPFLYQSIYFPFFHPFLFLFFLYISFLFVVSIIIFLYV